LAHPIRLIDLLLWVLQKDENPDRNRAAPFGVLVCFFLTKSTNSFSVSNKLRKKYIIINIDDEEDVKKELAESEPEDEIRQEMRRLSETSESRRLQVWQTNNQLQKAQQTLKELRQAIKMKVSLHYC